MKNHLMKLLFLLALCPMFASRTVAQDPYELEDWACSPESCNDDAGPTRNGAVSVSIAGTCYNGKEPTAVASALVSECMLPYQLGSGAQTVYKSITVNNVIYTNEGVYASAGIYDSLGEEVWFEYAWVYCDGSKRSFKEINLPC
jgi:hypothetical protein